MSARIPSAAPVAGEPSVRLSGVRFCYRGSDFELAIPDFSIERGEHVAVIGPSGSGKTTLLHLIAGIAVPEAGRVECVGEEISRMEDASRRDLRVRRIGLVFQEFELLEYLSVEENILLPYRINPVLRLGAAERARARVLAERVGLGDKLGRLATQLSHGEKQRAAVCRSLVVEPELLLADEPTGNLDPDNKDRVLEILVDYARERDATLVTVTHDYDLLKHFARVIDFREFGSAPGSESGNVR